MNKTKSKQMLNYTVAAGPLVFAVFALALLLLLPASRKGCAQVTTGTLYGTVEDPTGAVIPAAQVAITNVDTKAGKETVTNSLGQFSFSFVPPGNYVIVVTVAGFKRYEQSGLVVVAGQQASTVVKMELGTTQETVTVSAAPPLLATSPQENQTHTATEVEELPLAARDYTSLLTVANGVNLQGQNGTIYINNLPSAATSFTVDAVPAAGDASTSSPSQYQNYNDIKGLNQESIAEVQVVKSVYSADISSLSGNINLISKSGTNKWHGSLFENYQAGGFNARNPFASTGTPLIRHQYGGSAGGPILQDKLFIFGSIEKPNLISQATQVQYVPTPATKQTMIAGNPGVKQVLDWFPDANQPFAPGDVVGLWVGQNGSSARDLFAHVRGDWYLTPSDYLTMGWSHARPGAVEPRNGIDQRVREGFTERGTLSFTHTAGSWTSESRFGYNDSDTRRVGNFIRDLKGFPSVRCDCGFRIDGEDRSDGGSSASLQEVISLNRGRHNVKIGGTWILRRPSNADVESPEFRFRNVADFLSNTFRSVRFTWGVAPYQLNLWQLGGFIQDDFRFSNKLTLNLGLRYDYWSVVRERDNRLFNRGAPFGYGSLVDPNHAYAADIYNFQPRVGLAYRLNDQTVVRVGAGVFNSGHVSYGTLQSLVADGPGLPGRVDLTQSQAKELGVKFPTTLEQAQAMGIRSGLISGDAVDSRFPVPTSYQWTLAVERELVKDTVLNVAYVGNHAIHANLALDQNLPDRQTGQVPNPAYSVFSFTTGGESTTYNALQISIRRKFARSLSFDANYSYSRTFSFTNEMDLLGPPPPQDITKVYLDHGPSNIDIPQRFVADFIYETPRLEGLGEFPRYLLGAWQLSGIFSAQTGRPVDIVQGGDFETQRPDLAVSTRQAAIINQGLQYLDPKAFKEVPDGPGGVTYRPGLLSRNAFRQPGTWGLNLALAKNLQLNRFREGMRLQVRLEAFNALNHTKLVGFVSNLGGGFGTFTGTTAPRVVQLSGRFSF
jgi:hypothetical protein